VRPEAGERGDAGPGSYPELAERAERLAAISTACTEQAEARLQGAAPDERVAIETSMLARTLTDVELN
jgi:hypothetical protein